MKFSSNLFVILFIMISIVFLFSCSHNSCPAYTYQKKNEIKIEYNLKEKKTEFYRGT